MEAPNALRSCTCANKKRPQTERLSRWGQFAVVLPIGYRKLYCAGGITMGVTGTNSAGSNPFPAAKYPFMAAMVALRYSLIFARSAGSILAFVLARFRAEIAVP